MDVDGQRIAEVQPISASWFPRRRTASSQRADSYNMIRHVSSPFRLTHPECLLGCSAFLAHKICRCHGSRE
jgi:hypothetical protein